MIQQRLRKIGDHFVVTIPQDEVDRQGLREGDLLGLEVSSIEDQPHMRDIVRDAFEESWARSEAAYRYLADH
ncbi:MAG: hypothetical protein WKF80_05365 [Thermomicrobiales bacterium]